jgi:hypothetical protein
MAESSSGGGRKKTAFVRLEKPTYLEDIAHNRASNERHSLPTDFLIESGAAQKRKASLERAAKLKGVPAEQALGRAQGFSDRLDLVDRGASTPREQDAINRLRDKHATSSATSPYISATPTFTTGGEGQLHYLKGHLEKGRTAYVTLHASSRPITENRTNSRERELLVPFGERHDEMQGLLQVKPSADGKKVHAMFVDRTGEKPRLFTGRKAVSRFLELNPPAAAPSSSKKAAAPRFAPLGPQKGAASAPRPKAAITATKVPSRHAMPPIAQPKAHPAPKPAVPRVGPASAPLPAPAKKGGSI